MSIVFKDFSTAYLAAPLAVGGLTITVDNPLAFPILSGDDYFYLVLQKYSDRSYVEIVKVTATVGAVFTVLRGQAGTSIRTFSLGDYAELRLTSDSLAEFVSQRVSTKMDKSGGGDFNGLYRFLGASAGRIDLVRTPDSISSSLLVDFSPTEGHRVIVGGATGSNVVTPSMLLRPNGHSNGTGQVKIDKDGLVDAVALVMRGATQRTEAGAAVRYDELDKFVPKTRTVNGHDFTSDFSLTAADVSALSITGGTLTGSLVVKGGVPQLLTLDSTNAEGCLVKGYKDGVNDWYVGRANSAGDVSFYSYKHNTGLILKSDRTQSNRDLYVNNYKAYHQGFKPTAADVGAIPVNLVDGTPVAAYYRVATPNSVGTKIKLPFKMSHNKMAAFTVRVYQNYHTADIQFSGYLFSNGNQWYNPRATMIAGSKPISVAMGREDDGTAYVWVEGADYSCVAVFDVVAGYTGGDWNSGWVITSDDNKPNVKYAHTLYPPYSPNNKPAIADVTGLSDALLQAGGKPVLSADWVQLRSAMWNGFVAADGQTLNRADHPDAWAAIAAGKVPVVADADWLADPSKRGSFTTGNGTTTFRVPDYNGVQSGSYGPVYLGGGSVVGGAILRDRIQNITASGLYGGGRGLFAEDVAKLVGAFKKTRLPDGVVTQSTSNNFERYEVGFDASLVARTGDTTRPITVEGCWAIKLFGAVQNEGSIDAATLATAVAGLASRVSAVEGKVAVLEQRKSTCLVNATGTGAPHETVAAQLPATVGPNTRVVLPNPFGNNTPVKVEVQAFLAGKWGKTGFIFYGGAGLGIYGGWVQGEGIIVQSGAYTASNSATTGGLHNHTGGNITTPLPVRVFVTREDS